MRTLEEDGKTRGEYEWEDYKSVLAKVKDIGSGLRRIDLAPVRLILCTWIAHFHLYHYPMRLIERFLTRLTLLFGCNRAGKCYRPF